MGLPSGYYQDAIPVVTDWAGVVSFKPGAYLTPTSVAELKAILTYVQNCKPEKSVRFLGGLHSCSDILESEIVIDTSRLPITFTVTKVPGGGVEVVASAFMHVHDFLARAARHDLSLTSLGGTDAQTLAGLISTNTAGATAKNSIYDTVEWVEYLTVPAGGGALEAVRVEKAAPRFKAVICSLGVIGCLTLVGFKLVPQRYYKGSFEIRKLADVLDDVCKTSTSHEFWRIEWIPNKKVGLFWSANPILRQADGDYRSDKDEDKLRWLQKVNQKIWRNGPFSNWSLGLIYDVLVALYKRKTASGPMRYIIPCDRRAVLHVAMAEWSFDPADLERAMNACRTYFKKYKWPNMPVEIECTPTDDYMMSAWNWPGLATPYIMKFNFQYLTDFLDDGEKRAMVAHLRGLWEHLVAERIPFKAHWGKIHFWSRDTVVRSHDQAAFRSYAHAMFSNPALLALGIP